MPRIAQMFIRERCTGTQANSESLLLSPINMTVISSKGVFGRCSAIVNTSAITWEGW